MKTMGLNSLYLVQPKSFPDHKAKEMAAGADDILDNAVVTDTLRRGISWLPINTGTSARPRGLSLPGLIPASCADLVSHKLIILKLQLYLVESMQVLPTKNC